ncbi:MAG: McrC family protein [Ruminococcus sp.]|nr:McrC family protein [Ruminococcus sp.]
MCKIIFVRVNEVVLNGNKENKVDFEMLGDMLNHCDDDMKKLMIMNGKTIRASDHVGAIRLANDTQIEILPKAGSIADSKTIMLNKLCTLGDLPYSSGEISESITKDELFIEFFVEMFIKECMIIIKRGLISEYRTIEENSNILRGRLMFAENIRKNFYHSEKFYVKHEEFTFDKAENRLMRSATEFFLKITSIYQNRIQLRHILRYLDGVSVSENYDDDFAKCMDLRNSKKYVNMLNICRMFMQNDVFQQYSDKNVIYALFCKLC